MEEIDMEDIEEKKTLSRRLYGAILIWLKPK